LPGSLTEGSEISVFDYLTTASLDDPDKASCLAFSPDSSRLATCSRNSVQIRLPETGESVYAIPADDNVTGLAYSPDGHFLAGAIPELSSVLLWDSESGEMVNSYTVEGSRRLESVSFSPDGSILAAGCADGTVIFGRRNLSAG